MEKISHFNDIFIFEMIQSLGVFHAFLFLKSVCYCVETFEVNCLFDDNYV